VFHHRDQKQNWRVLDNGLSSLLIKISKLQAHIFRKLSKLWSLTINSLGFAVGSNGILAPDKCTEHELVFLQRSGHHSRIYTGVRHESWYNRWKVAPLAGGSRRWNQKLKLFNNIGLAGVATAASLNLMPLFGLTKLAMGAPASLSAVVSLDPVVFGSLWLVSHIITGIMYYFQYITPLVKSIYWEPDSRCVIGTALKFIV
jgi:hypothetical protein